ncbi:hypothetical protein HMN09_00018500 [Mycena chlorophos]|uniref:Methyltransferase domain-containing protein n=1 Tax=Mycena chlorophos TaxID=658473 RepID=A0A8H6TVB4_MYCCL|nr:hypothetical protein HMN09_00018500 [Mycena chlorophos]
MEATPINHAHRNYQQYPGAQYILPTDGPEKQRLARQHNMLKKLFGGRILFAPVDLKQGDKVLESGTGSGIWTVEVAATVDPSVEFIGVDIESGLFPEAPPQNLSFRVNSVLELPAEWSDTFTLVHQRLLLLGLQIPQWPQALEEIFRVVRPGGWVQLLEMAPIDAKIEQGSRPYTEKLTAILHSVMTARKLYLNVAHDLPKLLADAGFVDIQRDSRFQKVGKTPGEDDTESKNNTIGIFRGIKTPVLKAGGFGLVSSEEEYEALLEGFGREWDGLPPQDQEIIVVWGRKPLRS